MTRTDAHKLTDRQKAVLSFIQSRVEDVGYPPTIREIGEFLGIRSTNGVSDHLKALEKKGFLKRDGQKSRALVPVMQDVSDDDTPNNVTRLDFSATSDVVEIPLLGKVAAGAPILAQENRTGSVKVDSFFLGGTTKQVFALKVTGDSMIDDGIFDGDYIFVKKQLHADAGDIVVALIEDEATVKRFFPEGDRIRFQPANARLRPIYVRREDFRETQILGVVVGVYRKID
ncbi:MAG: transcriptional repressor LexA [Deltaproteobacteria bacterium]|nr:transcriptional repressor LexA [Deltaproteobacteria bacterium]